MDSNNDSKLQNVCKAEYLNYFEIRKDFGKTCTRHRMQFSVFCTHLFELHAALI